ncbi:MAG: NAD(P)-dependent oxidoreductase [Prolixibacteraceae bacterium]
MQQITIFGATGFVGKNLLKEAIKKGYAVKVLARNKEDLRGFEAFIEIVEGNYFDKDKLKNALNGSDVILSTVGPPKNGELSFEDEKKYINSMAFIIRQMEVNQQTRLINISGAGVKMANENLPLARKLLRVKLMAASKSTMNIKDRELQLLAQSNLDWTNIRPPMIQEKVEGELVADEIKFLGMAVDINQLCDFILAEIDNNEWIKKAPVLATKKINATKNNNELI